MRLDIKKEAIWIHNLWLVEEMEKQKPDDERVQSLRKVISALTAHEPSDEQRQTRQRIQVEQ